MNKQTQRRYDALYEKMLAQSEYHGDTEDLVRACAKIAMEQMDRAWDCAVEETACNTAWDCAVEETACNTSPDDELEGFVTVNKPNICKAKADFGYQYIEYDEAN
jgi:hypothetical protein